MGCGGGRQEGRCPVLAGERWQRELRAAQSVWVPPFHARHRAPRQLCSDPAAVCLGPPVAQVARDHAGCEGGAAAARASAGLGLPPLLRGYEVYLAGRCTAPLRRHRAVPGVVCLCRRVGRRVSLPSSRDQRTSHWTHHTSTRLHCPPFPPTAGEFANGGEVAELLQAAGAKRLSRPPTATHSAARGGPCTSFLLCEAPDAGGSPHQQQAAAAAGPAGQQGGAASAAAVPKVVPPALAAAKWYQKAAEAGVPVVSRRWLLDSISSYTVKPLAPYLL